MLGKRRRLALLAEGRFTPFEAKTAVGVLRYRPEQVAAGIERALRRHPPQIYLPARNRALAMLNSALPGLSDRIVNALFRYPRGR